MKERLLYRPMVAGANSEGFALYHIEDAGINQRPFDIVGCAPEGEFVGVEVKVIDHIPYEGEPLPWHQFSRHQCNWLAETGKRGGIALVALYVDPTQRMMLYRIDRADDLQAAAEDLYVCDLYCSPTHGGRWLNWGVIIGRTDIPPPAPEKSK